MSNEERKAREWFKYADEDSQMAEIAMKENGPPNQICFHAQQKAEKYLKGFLEFHGTRFEKQHQLPYLLEMAEVVDESLSELEEDIFLLNRFYIETRYPGNIPEFSIKEARGAVEAADRVEELISRKVNI